MSTSYKKQLLWFLGLSQAGNSTENIPRAAKYKRKQKEPPTAGFEGYQDWITEK